MEAKTIRGFAAMTLEKRREIAAKGGAAVDPNKRSFSLNRELAQSAGSKGGKATRKSKATVRVEDAAEAGP